MKFPIHTKKGPRYVTVNALDTGTILGSDWRSAEKEARFVENWGKAGRWTNRDMEAQRRHAELEAGYPGTGVEKQHDRYAARDFEKEAQEAEELARQERMFMPDVNSMSRKEFERYLDQVRRGRQGYLGTKLEALKESTRGAKEVAASGDRNTLIGLATRGLTSSGDPAHFQATLAHQEMTSDVKDPEQTQTPRIQSHPHMMYGLTYSTPSSSSSTSPVTGRVVSRNQSHQDRYGGGYNNNIGGRRNNNDDNKPWVVSVGGLTANLSNVNASVRDGGQRVKPVDYTRADADQGTYKFRIDKAELESPPKVHHLQQSNKAARWSGRYKSVSGANQPSPLDTFEFDIVLSNATPAQDDPSSTSSSSSSASSNAPTPGSKEWVARDPTSGESSRTMSPGDRLGASIGLGSSRKDRIGGQTLGFLDRLRGQAEEQKEANEKQRLYSEQNNDVARQLVQRLNLRNKGGSGSARE